MYTILYALFLCISGYFFIYKMFHPPLGPHYQLKTIIFTMNGHKVDKINQLGKYIYSIKSKRRFILPTEFDLWSEVILFENGIVFKRNKKEKVVFFHELYAIEPILINSLFVKNKYFGYIFKFKNKNKILLKSCNLYDLDIWISHLCSLFHSEVIEAIIIDRGTVIKESK